jgi:hypothetical protein
MDMKQSNNNNNLMNLNLDKGLNISKRLIITKR